MRPRRHLAGATVAILVCAFAAACSGDDDSSSRSVASTTSTTSATEPLTLQQVLDRQSDAVIKVTYQRGDHTFTIAQDHASRATVTDTAMSIVTPRRSVDCTDLDTTPQCLEVPRHVTGLVDTGLLFYDAVGQGLASAADASPPIATTRERVAGRPAVCAEGDAATFLASVQNKLGDIPDARVRVCIDAATGYLLEYRGPDPEDTLVATAVTKPTARDFRPPARVQRIGE
jgi:hypothetical protein